MIELYYNHNNESFYFTTRRFLLGRKRVIPYINEEKRIIIYDQVAIENLPSTTVEDRRFRQDLLHMFFNGLTHEEALEFIQSLPHTINSEIISKIDPYAIDELINYAIRRTKDECGIIDIKNKHDYIRNMMDKIDKVLNKDHRC